MNRYVRAIAGCFIGTAAAAASSQADVAASPIRSFDFTYQGTPEPGNRHWSSPDGVTWTELWPSGHTYSQRVAGAAQVGGCSGVVTTKPESPQSQTFIPDPGCPSMVLLFRFGDGTWRPIGAMRSVSTQSGAVPPSAARVMVMLGSGIFVNGDGFVLTNAHVVNGCKSIQVRAYNATPAPGLLEAVDPRNDLALVKTHEGYGSPVVFRSENKPARLGENIGVIGYPLPGVLSSEPKATFGQISSVAGMNNDYTLLQISAPIQPGNSGGPVFGEDGRVVGVIVSSVSPALIAKIGAIPQNVNFAIRGEIAQIFMTAHGINFHTLGFGRRLDTADMAEAGEKSTAQIVCVKS